MEELTDAKVSIKAGGAQIYNDAPLFVSISVDKIIIKTQIGKTDTKDLVIEIERNVYVEEKEENAGSKTIDGTSDGPE